MKKNIKLLIMMLVTMLAIASFMSVSVFATVSEEVNLTITDGNGQTESFPVEKGEYTLLTYTEYGFTAPDGQRFSYWEVGEEEKMPGDTIMLTEDTIINAVWEEIRYTITFSAGMGTGHKDPQTWGPSDYGIPDFVGFDAPGGYEFAGWSIEGEGEETLYKEGDVITLTGDITLVAIWKAKIYTVTFDKGEGSGEMTSATAKHGDEYELPECTFTAPADMEFAGWEIDGQPVSGTINVIDNVTVVATWQIIKYTVSFSAGEGSGDMTGAEIAPNGTFTLPACDLTAPDGKQFKCWSVGGEEKAVGATITVSGDVTVTAVWEFKTYAITFNAGEGASGTMTADTAVHGEAYTLPTPTFTAPEGKQFKCWSVNGAEFAAGLEVTVNSDLTVIAVWEDIPVADTETTTDTDTDTEADTDTETDTETETDSKTNTETETDSESNTNEGSDKNKKNGLDTGTIIAISIVAIVVLGGGGFAVYYFVIKKKED